MLIAAFRLAKEYRNTLSRTQSFVIYRFGMIRKMTFFVKTVQKGTYWMRYLRRIGKTFFPGAAVSCWLVNPFFFLYIPLKLLSKILIRKFAP